MSDDVLQLFLRTRRSDHTRRSYEVAIRDLEGEVGGGSVLSLQKEDVARWIAAMADEGVADTTINQRLAAVTQIYLHQLEQKLDLSWLRVRDMLGIGQSSSGVKNAKS